MDPAEVILRDRGPRVYVLTRGREIKESLKQAGAHWDPERHQWWIGSAKRAKLEQTIADLGLDWRYVPEGVPFRGVETKVIGSAMHDDEPFYVIWAGEKDGVPQMKLIATDASREFWTPGPNERTRWVKQYKRPRAVRELMDYAEKMENLRCGKCPVCAGERPGCEICGGAPAPKVPLFLGVNNFMRIMDSRRAGRLYWRIELGREWPRVWEVKGIDQDGEFRLMEVPRVNFDIRHITKNGKFGVRVFFSLPGGRIYLAREHLNFSKDRVFFVHATPAGEAKEVSEQWVRKALRGAILASTC